MILCVNGGRSAAGSLSHPPPPGVGKQWHGSNATTRGRFTTSCAGIFRLLHSCVETVESTPPPPHLRNEKLRPLHASLYTVAPESPPLSESAHFERRRDHMRSHTPGAVVFAFDVDSEAVAIDRTKKALKKALKIVDPPTKNPEPAENPAKRMKLEPESEPERCVRDSRGVTGGATTCTCGICTTNSCDRGCWVASSAPLRTEGTARAIHRPRFRTAVSAEWAAQRKTPGPSTTTINCFACFRGPENIGGVVWEGFPVRWPQLECSLWESTAESILKELIHTVAVRPKQWLG